MQEVEFSPTVAVMVAVASLAAALVLVTLPSASTVATVASLVVQVTSPWAPSGRVTVSTALSPAARDSSVRSSAMLPAEVLTSGEEAEVPP